MAYCPRITHRREITPPAPHSPRIFFHSLGRKVLNMTNVKEEAEKGEKLALLIAIRGKLAESLDRTESGRDIAALSKRLIQVADEIEEIERLTRPGTSKHDLLKAKRERQLNERRIENS